MRSEIFAVGALLAAIIMIFSRPGGPQLWTVAFLVVLLLYGLAFSHTYGYPWVEVHPHRNSSHDNKKREESHTPTGGGWRHY